MPMLAAVALLLAQEAPTPASVESRAVAYARLLREDATRDRAKDRLVHLGRSALPVLERLGVDAETIRSIGREIAENEAIGAAYGPPHLFSFPGAEEPLGELLARLETGAGVTFHKNSLDLSQKVSIFLPEATFWEAFDETCRKASIWYYPGDQFYLNGGGASPQPRAYYGPFMIVMERIIQQRKMTFDRTVSDYVIRLQCVWERTVSPLGPTGRYALTELTDDRGASLLPRDRTADPPRAASAQRISGQRIDLSGLTPPSAGARKLAVVRGTLEVEFPARMDEVEFEIGADPPAAPRAVLGARIELRSFQPSTNWGSAAEFLIRFQDPAEAEKFRIAAGDIEFIAPGNSPRTTWINAIQRDPAAGTYAFTALWRHGNGAELPRAVRLRMPRGSLIKNVPFCFKDIDLK